MKTKIHPVTVLELCTRIIAYLIAWTIRAHRYLVRIEFDFIRTPNAYALEAAALHHWRTLANPAAAFLLHIYGGSPHGVHLTFEEMRRWLGFVISGLGIAAGAWALHFSLGGRLDFHLLGANAVLNGGPLHTQNLWRRLQELAQQATEDLNARRLAAGLLPIGCLTLEGRVYYPDLRIEILKAPSHETAPQVEVAPPTVIVTSLEPPPTAGPTFEPIVPLPSTNDLAVASGETGPAQTPAPSPAVEKAPALPSPETPLAVDLTPPTDPMALPEAPLTGPVPAPQKPLPEKSEGTIAPDATTKTKAPASSTAAETDGAGDTTLELIKGPAQSQPKKSTPPAAAKCDPHVPAHEWERRVRLLAILAAAADAEASDEEWRRRDEAEKEILAKARHWIADARRFINQPTLKRDQRLEVVNEFMAAMQVAIPRLKERKQAREMNPDRDQRPASPDRA